MPDQCLPTVGHRECKIRENLNGISFFGKDTNFF